MFLCKKLIKYRRFVARQKLDSCECSEVVPNNRKFEAQGSIEEEMTIDHLFHIVRFFIQCLCSHTNATESIVLLRFRLTRSVNKARINTYCECAKAVQRRSRLVRD